MKKLLIISFITLLLGAYSQILYAQKITFIELGSNSCVPCKKMQPILKSLEKRYGDQLKVVFYDVWKKEHKDKSSKYGIKLIPTQIFQDENGKEIHRHEGFYPEKDIDKFLQSKGLKPKK